MLLEQADGSGDGGLERQNAWGLGLRALDHQSQGVDL
jgi:hypothetical protein